MCVSSCRARAHAGRSGHLAPAAAAARSESVRQRIIAAAVSAPPARAPRPRRKRIKPRTTRAIATYATTNHSTQPDHCSAGDASFWPSAFWSSCPGPVFEVPPLDQSAHFWDETLRLIDFLRYRKPNHHSDIMQVTNAPAGREGPGGARGLGQRRASEHACPDETPRTHQHISGGQMRRLRLFSGVFWKTKIAFGS